MNKPIQSLLFLCFCLFTTGLLAKNIYGSVNKETESIKDSIHNNRSVTANKIISPSKSVKTFRKFKSLEQFDTPVVVKKSTRLKVKEGFQFNTVDSLQNKKWLDMANNVFTTIDQTQNYVDLLSDSSLGQLPVAIRPMEISNVKYTVGIAKAVFKPAYTELTAFLKIETARGVLILGGSNIKLSHEGGIIGDAKLNLISQFTFNINDGKAVVTLNGSFEQPGTYALIDCSGFKELGVDADLKFSNGLLYPVDENGKERLGYVEGNFKTVVSDWNDIVVNISLPEFGIQGLEGTTFKLNTAIFDFSDLRNDAAMPQDYLAKYYNENPTLWRGVYINTLEVVLPKAFRKNNSDKRISFGASNLIIDGKGVTGKFEGENILTIDEGSASKWQFSLDRFLLDIETNRLKAGEFEGELLLPVSKEDRLKYAAIIQPDEYSFRVTNTNDIDFDVWSAKVILTKDSYVEMKVKEGKFRPKANLNGSVSIQSGLNKSSSGDKTVDFKGIVFENMLLQTESPKFSVDYFGYRGKMSVANFPITVNEIGLRTPSGDRAELVFDFNINLTSESDGGNGGGAKLAIKAQLEDRDGRDKWKYDGIRLERVFVKMEVAGMELKGAIFIFEDDPTYGTGFAGAVGAKFSVGMKLEVEAKALFGRKEDFRYWFADAQVTLPTGIPIFTAFSINSFGGGFYNHMKMAGVTHEKDAAFNQIGASTSGVIYEPYKENGFGLKASVGLITTGSEELFHGSLEFGISFLNSGGLQEIYFKGEGEMITSIPGDFYEKLADKLAVISQGNNPILPAYQPEGAMAANVFIKFDFVNDIFHATSELYINFGILKGVGPNGRAGWMDFYVGPDEWHILIGTPSDPVGVAMNLGIVKMRTESYFMMGDGLPGSPPPPDIVANILGVDVSKLDYTRDLNMLEAGKGLAFGANWSMSTGDLKFLIFYARFDAGVGFDIMLKDYGDAHCKGSSEQIGLNGWYANGQAYAYLQGEVGLKFKLFGKRKKITIFAGGGAVLMQARLPNPVWLRGYLGGKYNLLGGLIKGRFRFKVELGDKCEIVGGSALDGIVVIGEMAPKEGATGVDVFAAPQVPFNLQINRVFELPDDTGDRKYRILMDKFEVTKEGQPIVGEIEWNNNNDIAVFYSHEILPPNTSLKAYVQLHFEEKINGKWETIMDDGKVSIESKEVSFTTGEAPETIPLSNIAYMYPTIHQKNFFTKEYDKGYINLKRGQSYLFDAVPNWNKTMVMKSDTGAGMNKNFIYNAANRQVIFDLPKEMSTTTAYNVKIKLVPQENDNSNNVKESYTTQALDGESGNEVEIKSRKAEEVIIKGEERELLTFDFATSEYTTFDKKMSAMKTNKDLYRHVTYPYGLTLLNGINSLEPFDLVELVGNRFSGNKPLVVARAILDNSYYQNQIYPLLYQNYPIEGTITVSRDTDKISVPPLEGVEPMSWYLTYLENDRTSDINVYNPYRYNLTHYYYQDYEDLRYQLISSDLPWETMPKYKALIIDPFPIMRKGKYRTKLQYVLPGQVKNGGNDIVKYNNPLYE
ncbi:hypothetical protein [Aquimarina algiphila]|uniref:hypothetical protein n=1 Tax=Aquimarina algiphila TaxID=2047982 RepID=UPI0024923028|nr:hypothetical protein [Aquimarina algiphila]